MKVLHIIHNRDNKFYNSVIEIFEKTVFSNEYVCIVNDGESVPAIQTDKVRLVNRSESHMLWVRDDIDAFMFHPLHEGTYDWVLSIPSDKIVIDSSWGADLYYPQATCPPILQIKLFQKGTMKLVDRLTKNQVSFYKRLRKRIGKIYHHKAYLEFEEKRQKQHAIDLNKQQKVLGRIDLWATPLPIEYEMLRTRHHIQAEYFPFHYAPNDVFSTNDRVVWDDADMILLGNSADPSNNHVDLLMQLKKRGILNHYRLYVPLAYGDNKDYRSRLKQLLKKTMVDCFIQEDFMCVGDYKETLLKCRVAVFGHLRQQALGNVFLCMMHGSKVFFYKESMVYRYFKSKGASVYSIEDDLCVKEIETPMTEKEYNANKQVLQEFSIKHFLPEIEGTLEECYNRKKVCELRW